MHSGMHVTYAVYKQITYFFFTKKKRTLSFLLSFSLYRKFKKKNTPNDILICLAIKVSQ